MIFRRNNFPVSFGDFVMYVNHLNLPHAEEKVTSVYVFKYYSIRINTVNTHFAFMSPEHS